MIKMSKRMAFPIYRNEVSNRSSTRKIYSYEQRRSNMIDDLLSNCNHRHRNHPGHKQSLQYCRGYIHFRWSRTSSRHFLHRELTSTILLHWRISASTSPFRSIRRGHGHSRLGSRGLRRCLSWLLYFGRWLLRRRGWRKQRGQGC